MSLTTNIDNIYKNGVIGNVRKAQEDSHDIALQTPNGDVFVVCDGMGGHVGGAEASSRAVDSIISYLKKEQYANPIEALNGALQFANMQILGYASEHPELKGMGTTACIVLMQGNDVWIAHAGDSRIYLYLGKEKELHRITKDHSFVQTLVDAGEITDDQAEHHPQKNRILKALGIKPDLQPSFNYMNQPIHPKNGDIFLICSDGLCGMIPDTTIEKALSQNMTVAEKGNLLIQLAMQGETVVPGGQDNCTAELIQIDNSPWQKSEFKSYNPLRLNKTNQPSVGVNEPAKPVRNMNGGKKNAGKKKLMIIAIVVLAVLGACGFGIYMLLSGKNDVENNIKSYKMNLESMRDATIVMFDLPNAPDLKCRQIGIIDSLYLQIKDTTYIDSVRNVLSHKQFNKLKEEYDEIFHEADSIYKKVEIYKNENCK